jgi:eukaryotic-like serine/threonine-protein kinase
MSLTAGTQISSYEILARIGAGGMGEVYRARDQKLGRDVAIKVLPEEFARDDDRVARFQREARMLASLNHSNIAAIYGLEGSNGTNFLVLELVEGETLADQLKRGPIAVEDALRLALQISEALEAAHEKGVIHRDLKPANIKVTPDGKVKVLDFGLAKAFAGEQADVNLSNSPTLSNAATQLGVILGTAAYMSPEQARGKSVDKRTDIWAFGCVLFETLTGQAAFQGEDVTEILAAVVKSSANLDLLPADIHPGIPKIISRCLQKDPRKRYRDIGDVQFELEEILADSGNPLRRPGMAVEPHGRMRKIVPCVAAVVVLTAIASVLAVWNLRKPEPRQVTRFSYELPKAQQFGEERAIAISPDGKRFVYSTNEGLYLRSMDTMDARLLPGTEGELQRPFFTHDGKWIGFYSSSDKKLKKIAISGGAPVTLAEISPYGSFDSSKEDTIVFCDQGKGILRVSASGGVPEVIVKAGNESIAHPQLLPDGESVLFTRLTPAPWRVMAQSLKSGERKDLFKGDTARFLPTGHIVYADGNNLYTVPFDLHKLKVTGGAVPVVEGILRTGGAPHYALSESGTLVYVPGKAIEFYGRPRTLVWVDRKGKEEPLGAASINYESLKISPDGTRVALQGSIDGNTDIYIWDIARKIPDRLTINEAVDVVPLWSRDGKRIAFMSQRKSGFGVYWKAADGTGKEEILSPASDKQSVPFSWSRDGRTLVMTFGDDTHSDIGTLSMDGDRKIQPLLQEKYMEFCPQISPDGRWIAYTSNESGSDEIYVRPFPEVDKGRSRVSSNGGDAPLWSHDGRELFYRNGDAAMAVPVKTDPVFSSGIPEILFRGKYVSTSSDAAHPSNNPWDISPDGRFLMMKEPVAFEAGAPQRINIVLNWLEELKQKVPGR